MRKSILSLSVVLVAGSILTAQAGIMDKFKKKPDDPNTIDLKENVKKSEDKGAGNLRYSVSVSDIEKSYDHSS